MPDTRLARCSPSIPSNVRGNRRDQLTKVAAGGDIALPSPIGCATSAGLMAGAGTLLRLPWLLIPDVNLGGVDSRAKVEVLKLEDEWARNSDKRKKCGAKL
jgi:hypothetical protein